MTMQRWRWLSSASMPSASANAIIHVGARAGVHARRHPVQPRESHDVIDAQRARVHHVRAHHRNEFGVPRGGDMRGQRRRQAPVLAVQVEFVGRRADRGGLHVQVLVRPGIGAAGIDRYREIGIKADCEARVEAPFLDGCNLQLGLPLQILEKFDACGADGPKLSTAGYDFILQASRG